MKNSGLSATEADGAPFDPYQVSRPHPSLMKYYLLTSLLSGPVFPVTALVLYFRYETLRYQFRDDGVSMSWGILFRREVHLTYRRIQDIHLTRNLIQRWFGLSTVSIQTASGSSDPEMSIEGVLQAEELRDFLYGKMRGGSHDGMGAVGARTSSTPGATPTAVSISPPETASGAHQPDESLVLLREIRDSLGKLAARSGDAP